MTVGNTGRYESKAADFHISPLTVHELSVVLPETTLPVLSGTGTANAVVALAIPGISKTKTTASDDNGIWQYQLDERLASGEYTVTFTEKIGQYTQSTSSSLLVSCGDTNVTSNPTSTSQAYQTGSTLAPTRKSTPTASPSATPSPSPTPTIIVDTSYLPQLSGTGESEPSQGTPLPTPMPTPPASSGFWGWVVRFFNTLVGGSVLGTNTAQCVYILEPAVSEGFFTSDTSFVPFRQSQLSHTSDGVCEVSSGSTVDITVTKCGRDREGSNPDGITTPVSSIGSNSVTVASTTGFAVQDEALLINLQGSATAFSHVGAYEMVTIAAIEGKTMTMASDILGTYGNETNADLTGQKIVLQRIPHYTDVIVKSGGTLTGGAWNGTSGGVLVFRSTDTLTVEGKITMSQKGYRSGLAFKESSESYCSYGAGYTFPWSDASLPGYVLGDGIEGICGGGGGGLGGGEKDIGWEINKAIEQQFSQAGIDEGVAHQNILNNFANSWKSYSLLVGTGALGGLGGAGGAGGGGGGGGGYGTPGGGGHAMGSVVTYPPEVGKTGGEGVSGRGGFTFHKSQGGGGGGGGTYGQATLARLFMGSAGGAGGCSNQYQVRAGGIIFILGNTVNVSGSIEANGGAEVVIDSCMGGSSGGSILLVGNNIFVTNANGVVAHGGYAGKHTTIQYLYTDNGGGGGEGRIAVYFTDTFSGSTSPSCYQEKISGLP